jgi:dTDP-4-amino-4,6-dideoxygalactose transaminase
MAQLVNEKLAIEGGTPVRRERLPLHRPWIGDEEVEAAAEAIRRGSLVGNGPIGRQVEAELSKILGTPALFVSSCTGALEAALILLGVGHGDEVICPSFTFVSAANAIVRCGATPIFADIEPDSFNIDPDEIEARITPQTRAIVLVHYAGLACDMDRILKIAERHGLKVIEDAAHALGAKLHGRPLGTLGDFGCFSFHGTKDVVCGEGGALVCRRAEDQRRAEAVREKGTNRAQFLRGEVDKYTWVEEGSSYVASDVLAAMLRVQLMRLPDILSRKRELARRLTSLLEPLRGVVQLPIERSGVESSWHLYAILVPAAARDRIISALQHEGIGATFHYVPLHSSPFARDRFGSHLQNLPTTDRVSASLIRLPFFASMSDQDLEDVARATIKVVTRLVVTTCP